MTDILGSPGALGDELSRAVSRRIGGTFATRTTLKALDASLRVDGMLAMVATDGSLWRFVAASAVAADGADELVLVPAAGSGRWLRADKAFTMRIPFSAALADAAAILTVPEGFALRLTAHPYWEVTVAFTGGSSSAIGISTNITGYDTKGDLLGGASGDVAATLGAGIAAGTQGGELDDNVGFHAILLEEGNVIRYDEITSAFTAGSGFACVPVSVAVAPATP